MNLKDKDILQKPLSSPIAKQLASWLKAADKATGLFEGSIAGRVFMMALLKGNKKERACQRVF